MDRVTSLLGIALVLLEIGVVVAALGVIPGNRKPSTGMAWLILVIAVPLFGLLAFLLFGSARVGRKRQARQAPGERGHPERTAEVAELTERQPRPGVRRVGGDPQPRRSGPSPPLAGQHRRAVPRLRGSPSRR